MKRCISLMPRRIPRSAYDGGRELGSSKVDDIYFRIIIVYTLGCK